MWARDKSHPSYDKWGTGLFVRYREKEGYLVEYFTATGDVGSGVCGHFPEVRMDTPPMGEQLKRVQL